MSKFMLWLRDEDRKTESRTPLLPDGVKELAALGFGITVETSTKRIFPDAEYEQAGARIVPAGGWKSAPDGAVILGLKELPETPDIIGNDHIFFAHAYKNQSGWQDLLKRFKAGNSKILDIEYMVDGNGNRVVAFGYWAGYMGAALALIQWYDRISWAAPALDDGLAPFANAGTLDKTIKARNRVSIAPKVLVIGASGRSGKGAVELCRRHGVEVTCWGRKETAEIDRDELLAHDILINCVYIDKAVSPFLRREDLSNDARLRVICDVSCDPFSNFNPLPLYSAPTTWQKPYLTVGYNGGVVDLIAIDNLPSLLPRESSMEFATRLLPYLKTLDHHHTDPAWRASETAFKQACDKLTTSPADTNFKQKYAS